MQALKEHPDCCFILSAGDNSDDGQNEAQWNGVFYGLRGIVESIPLIMCTGNHDNRGYLKYSPTPVGKFYINHADLFDQKFEYSYPRNGPSGYETENFSFDYGNAHFSVLGINAQEITGEWLYNDLHKSDKTWKIGAYHFPIYPVMPEGVNDDSYPHLKRGIEEGRLDVLFSGHEHSFARTFPIKDEQLYDKPSQGTVHYIAGNAGENIYCSNCQKVWHSAFYPQEEPIGLYAVAEIDNSVMKITAYTTDGRTADEFIIDKEADIIKPFALAPVYKHTKMTYKGRMLELEARGMYCIKKDGVWFAAFPVLVQGIGGKVIKTPEKADVTVYKRRAVFILGSDVASTDRGDVKLSHPVFSNNGQLYVAVLDAAKIFDMHWRYAERNNFIEFNCQTEEKPLI
ncbi:MAG: Calcineurin-like phosphoesterase [Firmicutes bacterium ADurb.Bin300]|nr:MAG: Calcineurin-like phosphoesterase [Firmicutes bacterium ADurb.Bin300]